MDLPAVLAAVQADLAHFDLVLQLQIALRCPEPDRAGGGSQGRQDPLQKLPVILRRGHVHFGKMGNLLGQTVDLAANLFYLVDIGIRAYAHDRPRWGKGLDSYRRPKA
jgi:hypothetical protein